DHLLKAEGTRVLDVGCGPGTWILEMATEYPRTEFYGVDIRLMFPTTIKPSNAKFTQYNFIESLPYEDNTFDIVRMRLILGFLTEQKMVQVFKEIYRVLKPSGYVEILDCEYQVHRPGPLCLSFIMPTHQIGTLLMTHGNFVDIHQHRVRIPIGWGGHLGEVHGQDFQAFIRSIHPKLIRSHLSTDLDESMAKAVKECALNQSHVNWFVCYGQKPTNPLMPSNIHTQQDIHWDSATVHDDLTNCYYEEEI
ncbi:S-adenosyl-L-methionine-dependent methyltransferase, partial [Blakeslea trispora]